jgi:hypothetical protein
MTLFSQSPAELYANPTKPRWLIRDVLELGVIAILAGTRGSYKSFLALMWAVETAIAGEWAYVVSAEGNDFDRRLKAYMKIFHPEYNINELKLRVAQRRLDLTSHDTVTALRTECVKLGIRPRLWVFDTYSKLTPSLDENSNTDVKAWIGMIDRGFKRPPPEAFDATVLVVAHVGLSDDGRPRGASAFAADTDSELIVKRDKDGSIYVSRERFKASAELPPLRFKPEVVDLGYVDDDEKPVTSLVLREVVVEAQVNRPREPKGGTQKRVWDVVQEMCAGGVEARAAAVQEKVAGQMVVAEGKRDRRREVVARAMTELADQGFIYLHDDGRKVSLSRTMTVAEEEFDEDVDAHLR